MVAVPSTGSEQFTRCPTCRTVFRVTAAQLARRAGQVRCGHCKSVFDANVARVTSAPEMQHGRTGGEGARAGEPTSTQPPPAAVTGATVPATAAVPAAPKADAKRSARSDKSRADRNADAGRHRGQRAMRITYAAAIPFLVLLLGAQVLFHTSSTIATHWPATAPALTRLCETAGCLVRPVPDEAMQYLAIDASDLQADPAHKGLLILTATIRNRAAWTLAYPHLELTLTDAEDQVVVRRALAPAEYAGGTVDVAKGLAGRAELAVKLFIDASATAQNGYRLYLFYP